MANASLARTLSAVQPPSQSRIALGAYQLIFERTPGGGAVRLVGEDGAQPIEIEVTPAGPVLRLRAGLAIAVDGALDLTADRLSLHGRAALSLASDGAVDIRSGGDVAMQANDDVRLNGERIKLNC